VANCNNLVDNVSLNLSDIDLEFVATNAGVKVNSISHNYFRIIREILKDS